VANEKVAADRGLVAIERGPILYCLESPDNQFNINNFIIPDHAEMKVVFDKNLLSGINIIQGEGIEIKPASDQLSLVSAKKTFTAIPYNVWDNREPAVMRVWLPRTVNQFSLSAE
jgi:DUF1680 family protein